MAELRTNNPYANGIIEEYENGDQSLIRELITFDIDSIDNEYHIVTYEDRLDLLAFRFYRRKVQDASKYWWVIADSNNISNPLDLSELVGTRIVIPDIAKILLQI